MSFTSASLNQGIKDLRTFLAALLVDDLGKYQVAKSQFPAIWITPPDLPQSYTIIPSSGVELIINAEPAIGDGETVPRQTMILYFDLLLKQWDTKKTLTVPIAKIRRAEGLVMHSPPVVRPYQEINGEKFFAQARIRLIATDTDLFR
jgi:hypothetical protein